MNAKINMTKKELIAALRQDAESKDVFLSKRVVKDVLASMAVVICGDGGHSCNISVAGAGTAMVVDRKDVRVPDDDLKGAQSDPRIGSDGMALSGRFAGKILSVDGERVVQKIGRKESEQVWHAVDRLAGAPGVRVGDIVTIVCADDCWTVAKK